MKKFSYTDSNGRVRFGQVNGNKFSYEDSDGRVRFGQVNGNKFSYEDRNGRIRSGKNTYERNNSYNSGNSLARPILKVILGIFRNNYLLLFQNTLNTPLPNSNSCWVFFLLSASASRH